MSILTAAPSVNVKIAALAQRVQQLLSAHDADFGRDGGVLPYLSDAVTDARSRAERLAVTAANYAGAGEPADYGPERLAEIAWAGEAPGGVDALFSGEPLDVRDRVRLYVLWGVRKDQDDTEAEALAFRDALRSRDPDAPGVVAALRTDGYIAHTDADTGEAWEVEVRVEDVQTSFYAVDLKNREWRHEAAVTITLTGAPR